MTVANAGQRGSEGVKEFTVPYGERELKIAVVSGLGNADNLLERIKAGEHFDFIEVMACPGGCVNGGGQPYGGQAGTEEKSKKLYDVDLLHSIRRSEENPVITTIYQEIIKGKVHELLHVDYTKGEKND